MSLYGLIMAGGSGSRLWPRSRRRRPKQFLPLLSERTMLQETVERVAPIIDIERILVVTGQEYAGLVQEQLPDLPAQNIIGEPSGKGTAPCIGLGAIEIAQREPHATMVVLSADHAIQRTDAFRQVLKAAEDVAGDGYLVTLGVGPDRPHTGYGYIQRGAGLGSRHGFDVYEVARFVEKPRRETAEQYLAQGGYSWNAGIFVWRVDAIMAAFQQHMPALHAQLGQLAGAGGLGQADAFAEIWRAIENQTIDYGIMERAQRVTIIPVDIGWSDVGDWHTLAELAGAGADANVEQADHVGVDTRGTLIYSDNDRLIATVGLEDFVVVDTGDVLMIAPRQRAQDVKKLVDELRFRQRLELL